MAAYDLWAEYELRGGRQGSWGQLTQSNKATANKLRAERLRAMKVAAKRRQRDSLLAERDRLAGEMQAQQDEANRANTGRYAAQIAALGDIGRGTRMQIRKTANRSMASAMQALTSRGVGGATVVGSLAKRAGEAAGLGYAQLADRMAQASIQVHGAVSDVGPNMGALTSASSALGYGLASRPMPQAPRGAAMPGAYQLTPDQLRGVRPQPGAAVVQRKRPGVWSRLSGLLNQWTTRK